MSRPAPAATCSQRSARRPIASPTTTRASSRNATGLAAAESPASPANRHGRRACSAHSASSASAAPSANGKAAETMIPAQTTAKVRLDQRARGPHSFQTRTAKASVAVAIVATASNRIPSAAASG